MKKYVAFVLGLVFVSHLSAQLPSGSQAPDFSATDINGQTWNLYDILASGKIVVLEVSATWCPPCWAYHNSGAMQELYAAHGPDGDNRLQVLFVEGDPNTNFDCLHGLPGCNDYSLGNYVAGVSYPIFDNAAIADSFQVAFLPAVLIICPNKKVYEVNPVGSEALWEEAQHCPVAYGANNAGIFQYDPGTPLYEICGTANLAPAFNLVNLGTTNLQSATIELQWDNNTVQTLQWYGNLPLYGEAPIALDNWNVSSNGALKTQVTLVNNGGDDDFSNNVQINHFTEAAEFNSQQIILKIRTDNYAIETYWELRDDLGNILDHGGNENVGPEGGNVIFNLAAGPGTYPNNALIKDTLTLPAGGCYSLHFVDAYGDGMCCNFGNGYYKLYNIDNPVIPVFTGGEFGAYDDRGFGVPTLSAVQEATAITDLDMYPNPAASQLFLEWEVDDASFQVQGAVYNTLGQHVLRFYPEKTGTARQYAVLSLQDWPEGMYWLHLQGGKETLVRKFMVQR
jgi:thiol-disulfide isomerase/thioredoxin